MVAGDSIPDSFSCGPLEIASTRLIEILRRFVSEYEVETLSVELLDSPNDQYWVVNPLGFVDAIDRDKAEYTEESGVVARVSRLVLCPERLPTRHLFALDAIEWIWVVSDELAEAIAQEPLRGLSLMPVDEWKPY